MPNAVFDLPEYFVSRSAACLAKLAVEWL